MSKPVRRAQRRSVSSLSVRAGALTATPGRLRPLWSEIMPPTSTRVRDAGAVDRGDLEVDAAVVDEDAVAGADVVGKPEVGRGDLVAVAGNVFGGDGEVVAEAEADGAFREPAEPDLGALEVGEHADATTELGGGLPHPVVNLLVQLVAAMAEVETGHVHSRDDEFAEAFGRGGGGAKSADDFRATSHGSHPNWYRPLGCDVRHDADRKTG